MLFKDILTFLRLVHRDGILRILYILFKESVFQKSDEQDNYIAQKVAIKLKKSARLNECRDFW